MNLELYKKRRLRNTQAILTRLQIREIGKLLGHKSFRESVEFLMDPYNYFKLSKVKMAEIHNYLLSKGVTQKKCPNSHIRQGDHTRMLISILFPGYSIVKASEQHYQSLRENRSPQAKIVDLAYDQLPTTDKYERLDELFRADVHWVTDRQSKSDSCTIEIPLKKLNRSVISEGHATSNLNLRLFLYLWTSERMSWTPTEIELCVDDVDCLTKQDKELNGFGFKHIDITDKSELIKKANRRSTGSIELKVLFNSEKRPTIRHVSVCAVIEKTPEELASQLYVQTAALYIGRAMEKSSRNIPLAQQVQQTAVNILTSYDSNDMLELNKTETLFLASAKSFSQEWNEIEEEEEEDNDVEIYTGDEVISMLDPITLEKIRHPIRCIFCRHCTCFDAVVFFKYQTTSMNWTCPLCSVKIRGIQDLYIDYQIKHIMVQYPNEERFSRDKHNVYSVIQLDTAVKTELVLDETSKRKLDLVDSDHPTHTKRLK